MTRNTRGRRLVAAALTMALGMGWIGAAETALKLPSIWSEHAVLQTGRALPLWGWAAPGATVTVRLTPAAGAAADYLFACEAVAGADGVWCLEMPAIDEAGQTFVLTVADGAATLTVGDLLSGEVWLCSGQSNMAWALSNTDGAEQEIAGANYPWLRVFRAARTPLPEVADDVGGAWVVCTPAAARAFTAVGYYFAKALHIDLRVPVGLVDNSWGGMPAQAYTSLDALKNGGFDRYVKAQEAAAAKAAKPDMSKEEWEALRRDYAQKLKAYNDGIAALRETAAKEIGAAKTGTAPTEAAPDFDDAGWKTMKLPVQWEKVAGLDNLDGAVWFRKTIEVPTDWGGRELKLKLGPVHDTDATFWNGKLVGGSDEWDWAREYAIPADAVAAGQAVIAVKVFDWGHAGGFLGKEMAVAPADGGEALSLAGDWHYIITDDIRAQATPGVEPGQVAPSTPAALYNGMTAPLIPFALRGAIWYQGESNAGAAEEYRTLFPAMIKDWRARWGYDFPFYWAQLANFMKRRDEPSESNWAKLREAQSMTLSLPNTGEAVLIDIGVADDIHPRNKKDVGERLYRWAKRFTYGAPAGYVYSGPRFRSMTADGGKLLLSFDHAGGGLVAKDGPLTGFAVAGADGKFVWAKAAIEGDRVAVWADGVAAPRSVRYAWADNPACNLYNAEGLPASPFRAGDDAK